MAGLLIDKRAYTALRVFCLSRRRDFPKAESKPGGFLITLPHEMLTQLKTLRRQNESESDVICRMVAESMKTERRPQ